jgi:hypothetical protein
MMLLVATEVSQSVVIVANDSNPARCEPIFARTGGISAIVCGGINGERNEISPYTPFCNGRYAAREVNNSRTGNKDITKL